MILSLKIFIPDRPSSPTDYPEKPAEKILDDKGVACALLAIR
jgi:hypothetical protein